VTRLTLLYLLFLTLNGFSQMRIEMRILDESKPLQFVSVTLNDGKLHAVSDKDGIVDFNLTSQTTLRVNAYLIGYEAFQTLINTSDYLNKPLIIHLQQTSTLLNELVVSGNRYLGRRSESAVLINVLDGKTLELTQSSSLSEGLCFQPGLRVETDCQTCGFSQLRMNGLGGSYSQILINSRPVFPALLSLYGLEQFPAKLIDRVEIVKGGGSVLYGSSAIAGTVNIITSTPQENDWSADVTSSLIGGNAMDINTNGHSQSVSKSKKQGISIMLSGRKRSSFDANKDGFSELPELSSATLGISAFQKIGQRGNLELNAFNINEERQGGNRIGERAELADQGEYRLHHIFSGDMNYQHVFSDSSGLMVYVAAQNTWRSHYTGIDHSDGWGISRNISTQGGIQYFKELKDFPLGKNRLTIGAESQWQYTFDEIKAYNYLIDQEVALSAAFMQSEWSVMKKFHVMTGYRINFSNRVKGNISTPRFGLRWNPAKRWQFRASMASGFKAPQAFETDMHIAFAGGGISTIQLDPNLKSEYSNGYTSSIEYTISKTNYVLGLSIDAFYTELKNTFILEELSSDAQGNMILYRSNGGSSIYKGINVEVRYALKDDILIQSGFTFQNAMLQDSLKWSQDVAGTRKQLRTPDYYGYTILSFFNEHRFNPSANAVFTGPMLVPHFAGAPGVLKDELYQSAWFVDLGIRLSYRTKLRIGKKELSFHSGIQNILNAYQQDFDSGMNRDSNYVYGPMKPRTIYFGIKL
jgi:outer membrane receptor for ferrienterochelin and colicins